MDTVPLNARDFGGEGKPPLLILHGLLGSSRNWMTAGKALSDDFHVCALDLRNHGDSPHTNTMDYSSMAEDVRAWMDHHEIQRATLIGHSMGGKTAMRFATSYPDRTERLIVVDIAPVDYKPRWEREFEIMEQLPVASFRSRADAEAALEEHIKDWAFRKFLATNLDRVSGGDGLRWTINLKSLHRSLPELFGNALADDETFDGPTLFIRGENSRFLTEAHVPAIRKHFPSAQLKTVAGAHHNVHFDNLKGFLEALQT